MKSWFPFTDYDFYAYITSGVIVLAGMDYTFFGSVLIDKAEWTLVQGIFWTMISYLIGHILAGLSSFFIEHLLTRTMLCSPVFVILGLKQPGIFLKAFALVFAREYSAFPPTMCNQIIEKLSEKLKCDRDKLTDSEEIFQTAFSISRYEPSSETRLNQFMNLYGFCRNTSLSFLIVTGLLSYKMNFAFTRETGWLFCIALTMSFGMYGRFLKFYSGYAREILRTFGGRPL